MLFSISGNKKLDASKNGKAEVIGLSLAPNTKSGVNVCSDATPVCITHCLDETGLGQVNENQALRIAKTLYFLLDRTEFLKQMLSDVERMNKRVQNKSKSLYVRPNTFSDLAWERISPELFRDPSITWYDYTKSYDRMCDYLEQRPHWPKNYHLCFSMSEQNQDQCHELLERGANVAVVVRSDQDKPLRNHPFSSYRWVDGDQTDLWWYKQSGVLGLLRAKGSIKLDTEGFVQESMAA